MLNASSCLLSLFPSSLPLLSHIKQSLYLWHPPPALTVATILGCIPQTLPTIPDDNRAAFSVMHVKVQDLFGCNTTVSIPIEGGFYLVGVYDFNAYVPLNVLDQNTFCDMHLEVRDVEPPLVTCTSDTITLNASSEGFGSLGHCIDAQDNRTVLCSEFSARDNVGVTRVLFYPSDRVPLGHRWVAFKAYDAAGLYSYCSVYVHVVDVTPPTMQCPTTITVPEPFDHLTYNTTVSFSIKDPGGLWNWAAYNPNLLIHSRAFPFSTGDAVAQWGVVDNMDIVVRVSDSFVVSGTAGTNSSIRIIVWDQRGFNTFCDIAIVRLLSPLTRSLQSLNQLNASLPQVPTTLIDVLENRAAAEITGGQAQLIVESAAAVFESGAHNTSTVFRVLDRLGFLSIPALSTRTHNDTAYVGDILRDIIMDFVADVSTPTGPLENSSVVRS